jgi:hypothetical protein
MKNLDSDYFGYDSYMMIFYKESDQLSESFSPNESDRLNGMVTILF